MLSKLAPTEQSIKSIGRKRRGSKFLERGESSTDCKEMDINKWEEMAVE